MKTNYILVALATVGMLSSCADTEIREFVVEKPQSIAQQEYLLQYGNIKDYVSSAASPNFKVGVALAASDYNKKGVWYRVANENFDEITLGNAMKYASVVGDDGEMNFSLINELLANASAANMSVFGHTLCWHEQQRVKYLNKLIEDKAMEIDPDQQNDIEDYLIDYSTYSKFPFYVMGYEPVFEDGMMRTENPGGVDSPSWYQYFAGDGVSWVEGREYTLTVMAQASEEVVIPINCGDWGTASSTSIRIGTEMKEYQTKVTAASTTTGFVIAQPGTATAKVDFKWLKVSHSEAPSIKVLHDVLTNGDAETEDASCFFAVEYPGSLQACAREEGAGVDGSAAWVVHTKDKVANSWDSQFFIRTPNVYTEGDEFTVEFDYRADKAAKTETQAHAEPTAYLHWELLGNVEFSTEWKHFKKDVIVSSSQSGMMTIAFNLNAFEEANNYYFDNVKLGKVTEGNTIPLTDEEKYEIISNEMDRWIAGMMEACNGQVKAWDLVNECVSGSRGTDGFYALNSASIWDPATAGEKFFWRDYLGDDFPRLLVKMAREHFEEFGGDPAELKLFINDFNLESDWDDNLKIKSLIHWIERWESDGVTKIDGIATQMHVSYYENEATQASKEQHIVNMLTLMAKTGKLVKISELDMGYVDKYGNDLSTSELTWEQHLRMAHYYKFIVKKYLEIVPPEQQYAITQWCMTDAPEGSGWRAGSPVGLWDLNWNRKPAYGGFIDGLRGVE